MWQGIPGLLHSLWRANLHKHTLSVRQRVAVGIENRRFDPVLSTFIAKHSALKPNRFARRNRAPEIHLHMACHRSQPACAHRLAHRLIEQRCNNAAVQKSRMPFEPVRNAYGTYHSTILCKEKLELQAARICFTTSKAAVLSTVRQWREIVKMRPHQNTRARQGSFMAPAYRTRAARMRLMWLEKSVPAFTLLGCIFLAGCHDTFMVGCGTAPKLTPQQTEGKHLYQVRCSHCHEDNDLALKKVPPDLHGVFSSEKLPSGAPATDAQVRQVVLQGKGMMPAFVGRFDDAQMSALLAYLHAGLR